jgi:hypothetical protein
VKTFHGRGSVAEGCIRSDDHSSTSTVLVSTGLASLVLAKKTECASHVMSTITNVKGYIVDKVVGREASPWVEKTLQRRVFLLQASEFPLTFEAVWGTFVWTW